jgi:tetratricopeptide (TPR) repeat protein
MSAMNRAALFAAARMSATSLVLVTLSALMHGSIMRAQQASDASQEIRQLARQANDDLHQQKLSEAAAIYRQILILDPGNVSAHSNLGLAEYMQGHYPQAAAEFEIALRHQPELWNIEGLCGLSEAESGQNQDATAHLRQAFAHVDDPSLRATVGKHLFAILMQTGDLHGAAEVTEELRKLDPANADVLYAAHQVYALLANQAFLALGQAAPDSARMYQLQGDEMAQIGNISGAITAYKTAIGLDPHLTGVHFALGEALSVSHAAENQAQAEGEYKLALADNPQDEKALCRLGSIESQRSNWPAATKDFRRALELEPGDADANVGLGIVLMSTGSSPAAVNYLNRAVQIDPLDESAWYHLSLATRNAGDMAAATRAMQQFQKLKAKDDELERNYRNLREAPAGATSAAEPVPPSGVPH